MSNILDTVLLLALPASGKSEVRTYLGSLEPQECKNDFGIGETVQLDDYPYVHIMRRIDEGLIARNQPTVFFKAMDQGFQDTKNWLTLIELLNEDYRFLHGTEFEAYESAAPGIFKRMTSAAIKVGAKPVIDTINPEILCEIAKDTDDEATRVYTDLASARPDSLNGRTIVIEFARGGPDGSSMPLPYPLGYESSFAHLSHDILSKASICYIWVAPEESRRKNFERADPNDPGSILNHGVPISVMMQDYGCDDMEHLLSTSDRPSTVTVKTADQVFHLPIGRFDNRVDRTSFLRKPRSQWSEKSLAGVHDGLQQAFDTIRK